MFIFFHAPKEARSEFYQKTISTKRGFYGPSYYVICENNVRADYPGDGRDLISKWSHGLLSLTKANVQRRPKTKYRFLKTRGVLCANLYIDFGNRKQYMISLDLETIVYMVV